MSFIGPVIPGQLRSNQESQDSDSDSSDDNYGPKLPSEPCRGPAPPPPQLPQSSAQLVTAMMMTMVHLYLYICNKVQHKFPSNINKMTQVMMTL